MIRYSVHQTTRCLDKGPAKTAITSLSFQSQASIGNQGLDWMDSSQHSLHASTSMGSDVFSCSFLEWKIDTIETSRMFTGSAS